MPSLRVLCRGHKAVVLQLLMGVVSILGSAIPAGAEPLRAEIVTQLGHSGAVRSAALSPDGRTALTGSDDNTARLWDVASGRELRQLTGHTDPVYYVAFSPDGRTVLTASADH